MLGPKRKFLGLAMYISFFWCSFHLRLEANANAVLRGIWALVFTNGRTSHHYCLDVGDEVEKGWYKSYPPWMSDLVSQMHVCILSANYDDTSMDIELLCLVDS